MTLALTVAAALIVAPLVESILAAIAAALVEERYRTVLARQDQWIRDEVEKQRARDRAASQPQPTWGIRLWSYLWH